MVRSRGTVVASGGGSRTRRDAFGLLLVSLAAASAGAQTFDRVGLPAGEDPSNPAFTDAYGVSDDGTVVGSMNVPGLGFVGFRWTRDGGLEQLDGLEPGSGFFARAVTPDGSVIVGENTSPNSAVRFVNGVIQDLSFPQTGEYDQSAATDLSNDGRVVVGLLSRVEDATFRAARWREGSGWQDLGVLSSNDFESAANAVSGDGSIAAGYSVGDFFTAVAWTDAGIEALVNPFGIQSDTAVIAMSVSGEVFGGQARDESGLSHAAVWRADGTAQVLQTLGGFEESAVFAVSGDGTLFAGSASRTGGTDRAVFWTADGRVFDLQAFLEGRGINLDGWDLNAVTEISQNGLYLTGRGINPDGFLESFLVTIPAPGAATALGAAGLLAARRRRA